MKHFILIVILLAGCQKIAVFNQAEVQAITDACTRSNGTVSNSYQAKTDAVAMTYEITCKAQFNGESK